VVLSRYLLHESSRPDAGSTIVEAGAGTGLVSMALGSAPADLGWSVVATDGDHLALKNIRRNLGLNRLAGRVAVEQWDWYAPTLPRWADSVDLIVASDVVYGNLCPSTAYFFLARRIAEILSPLSPSGTARAAAAAAADQEAPRRPPEALMLLQVRGGDYAGSTVEAFALELARRGLRVDAQPIPSHALAAAPPDIHPALRLLRIAAPAPAADGAPASPIDYGPRPADHASAASGGGGGDPLDELQWGQVE
jgi:hypothetical protein